MSNDGNSWNSKRAQSSKDRKKCAKSTKSAKKVAIVQPITPLTRPTICHLKVRSLRCWKNRAASVISTEDNLNNSLVTLNGTQSTEKIAQHTLECSKVAMGCIKGANKSRSPYQGAEALTNLSFPIAQEDLSALSMVIYCKASLYNQAIFRWAGKSTQCRAIGRQISTSHPMSPKMPSGWAEERGLMFPY
jgi:hypothetical protein